MEQPLGYVAQRENKVCCLEKKPSMTSSRVHERDLRSSASPFLALIFTGVTQITLSSSDTQNLAS